MAAGLIKLALLLEIRNRSDKAEPLCRRALAINEAKYGYDHPEVAINLSILAGLLQDMNRCTEAVPLYRKAMQIWEKFLELDDPQVAIDFNNVSRLFRDRHGLNESEPLFRCAEPLFRRALTICDNFYGPDHPNVAICLNNLAVLIQDLAVLFKDAGRLDDAEPLYLRADAIFGLRLGSAHPSTLRLRKNLVALVEARELRDLEHRIGRSSAIDALLLSDVLRRTTSQPAPIIPPIAPLAAFARRPANGSGANSRRRKASRVVLSRLQAWSTAFHTAGASRPWTPRRPSPNCPLRMRCINSMPAIVIAAVAKPLKPSIVAIRCFTP